MSNDAWDVRCVRPVVDGKVWNPEMKQVEEAGRDGYTPSPPSVDVRTSQTVRASFPVSVDKLFVKIAKHIQDGSYSIVSIGASAYSFVIVCISELTSDEFMKLSFTMFSAERKGG
jgi:hypothetical protein